MVRAILCLILVSAPAVHAAGVRKPVGVFASSGAFDPSFHSHESLRGVLVRATWKDIEPAPGVFQFTAIDRQVAALAASGTRWSLAVIGGGVGSPDWLTGQLGAPYVGYSFRGTPGYRLPLFWNVVVRQRIASLAEALGGRYNGDPDLSLVYVTQMTSNGIEGHLQGVDMQVLKSAGYTADAWVSAGKAASVAFASAFPAKPIAFEVHEIDGGSTVPSRIINELWADESLEHRVGAAVWWVSGDWDYQADLLAELMDYPGDIYGQVIGRSDQPERFEEGSYASVFEQAAELGIRYLEPWEFEFKTGAAGADGAWDGELAAFNTWAIRRFGDGSIELAAPRVERLDGGIRISWTGVSGVPDQLQRSTDLSGWQPVADVRPTVDGAVTLTEPVPSGPVYYRIKRETGTP